ncbi:MAG: ABC transporter permease [Nitrososphaerales archaeon]|nr:ABC transporter permease [Nitrososphaerales archaeon]
MATQPATEITPQTKRRSASQAAVAWRRFKKNKAALVGAFLIGGLVFMAVFNQQLARFPAQPAYDAYYPLHHQQSAGPPSWEYPLGTSFGGTDVLSEIIHGSVWTLYVALGATAITMAIAIVVGLAAGYYGKYVDDGLMRFTEVFLVFPSLLLILVAAREFTLVYHSATFTVPVVNIELPVGLTAVVVILAVFGWAGIARLVRGQLLSLKELEYIQAAKTIGAGGKRIMFRHMFPNILSQIIVVATLNMAGFVIAEAAVSFLGFGDPNTVTWGQILENNFSYVTVVPWAEIFPGLAILFTVLGFNLLGDGLADALNPRIRD